MAVDTEWIAGRAISLRGRARFRLHGPDRVRYLNGQVTNDVARLRAGESCYALVCDRKGRLEADVFIHARSDDLLIDADGSLRDALFARLQRYLVADDCEFEDVTEQWNQIHTIAEGPPGGDAVTETSDDFETIAEAEIFPVSRFGPTGHDWWLPANRVVAWAFLTQGEVECLRLEFAVPRWGAELTPDVLPQEARLEDGAVDFHKGCYIGQEVISRIRSVGHVNRVLCALEAVPGSAVLQAGDRLFSSDPPTVVGTITSACYHPQLQKSIALGYVKRTFATGGADLRAGADDSVPSVAVKIRDVPAAPLRT